MRGPEIDHNVSPGSRVGFVGRNDHAGRRRSRIQQAHRHVRHTVLEEAPSRSEHEWMDQQDEPVHEPSPHEFPNQLAAAKDDKVIVVLLLESTDGVAGVTLEECRVLPR
jgi:hypothetical protein